MKGDWAWLRPDAPPGGWAFQYENAHYPDVDDTAMVAMLIHRAGDPAHDEAVALARDWILGMQSRNGGWGAFDADNDYQFPQPHPVRRPRRPAGTRRPST